MREITQLYKKTDDGLPGPKWIDELALYLCSLKESDWCNSIVDLSEGAVKMDEDLLLLWKHGQYFSALFMTESVCTVTTDSPPRQLRSRTMHDSTPGSVRDTSGGTKLSYDGAGC